MYIQDNIILFRSEFDPLNVKLITVSKMQPIDNIQKAYDTGQRVFGENKAMELNEKYKVLPKDIEWNFIGHLQTNKVKYIAPYVSMIHSIDSIKLLTEVNKEAQKNNRIIDCLLEFHIASEKTKYGLSLDEAKEIIISDIFSTLKNVRMCGVMGMASFCDDNDIIRDEFKLLKYYFDTIKKEFFMNDLHFSQISMGMTGDYKIAIEEGSTMVRIGTGIFS